MSLIDLKNVTKIYGQDDGDQCVQCTALDNVSLKIEEGEFVTIMGPSGSGKSTLMNMIGFLDVPSKGNYIFDNKKVTDFDEDSLADIRNREIGFVFQFFYLLPRMTAMENVRMPMIYADIKESEQIKKAEKTLKEVGLGHRINHRPNELSGGQQQRVAIARALVNEPKIILADEPTGNIDSKSAIDVMKILKKLNSEGKTLIIVTHDKEVARYAHRIVKIKDGKIISDKKNTPK